MVTINTIKASSYVGEVGWGITNPFYIECNGEIYVAKVIDDGADPKHLVNEVVCYLLAKKLELPIPEAAIIEADSELLNSIPALEKRGIQSVLLFGSKLIEPAQSKISPFLLEQVVNKVDVPDIVLFDQIIYNDDRARNKGNLIIEFKKKLLYAIDHTHAFKDGSLWTSDSLKKINANKEYKISKFQGKYYSMLQKYINGYNPFDRMKNKLGNITKQDLISIVDQVPEEWGTTEDEKKELIEFIWHRINNVDAILQEIKNECPHWKGAV